VQPYLDLLRRDRDHRRARLGRPVARGGGRVRLPGRTVSGLCAPVPVAGTAASAVVAPYADVVGIVLLLRSAHGRAAARRRGSDPRPLAPLRVVR